MNTFKKKKVVNIAIIGLGNIGVSLYKYLTANKNIIANKTNVVPNVIYVSAKNIRKNRNIKIPKNKWLKNYLEATKIKKIDVVVELIGGSDGPAKKLVFEALKNKKHVVTANKALISKYGDKLSLIAEKNKCNLEFEAAVCGGVPIIRLIKEGLVANNINKIYGIFNGTSNFILSCMDRKNITFDNAISLAQKLGYAESNPTSDINGEDVSAKLKILSSLCFNTFVNKNIYVEGIKDINQIDIINSNKLGYKIKLLGIAEKKDSKLTQKVYPCLVKKTSYIGSIDGVLNAVIISGNPVGQSIIQGEGAGPNPTTSALVSDISSILRGNIKYPFTISSGKRKAIKFFSISNQFYSAYMRLDVKDEHGILSNITKIFSKNKVSIKRLIQNPIKTKKYSSVIIITHKAKDSSLMNTIKQLSNKKYVLKKPRLIRIEEDL
ncbi:homoserine dehydrogenase [Pelagibacteraceae bacterium]|nr:homoserine dehydrogenase [Pelagibacteraceae bacterium]